MKKVLITILLLVLSPILLLIFSAWVVYEEIERLYKPRDRL